MKPSRRDFLKAGGLAGLGLAAASLVKADPAVAEDPGRLGAIADQVRREHPAGFNMCGFAAPKIETVRIGLIGIGKRGGGAVRRLAEIDGIEIKAVCDVRRARAEGARAILAGTRHQPKVYADGPDAWKAMCDSDDIDLVYICTPWDLHSPMAVYAMEQGKHAAVEVPAAVTVDDCWQLVETSERTRRHCRMLENCCYDFFELMTLNMARQGFFGEVIHGDGAYLHHIEEMFYKDGVRGAYSDLWRLKQNARRNGNLYPTHGLGPICTIMKVNRGDRLDHLTSMSSDDFTMGETARELARTDPAFAPYAGMRFRGDLNTSIIRTARGRTIMLQHDVSTPRVYSRIHHIHGTKAMAAKYPLPPRISLAGGDDLWASDAAFKRLEARFTPAIVKKLARATGKMKSRLGGHSDMDFLSDWSLLHCLWNGLPLDQDVYDAAAWSVISPLTEWSVANRSAPIDVPDFTRGKWRTNPLVDSFLQAT